MGVTPGSTDGNGRPTTPSDLNQMIRSAIQLIPTITPRSLLASNITPREIVTRAKVPPNGWSKKSSNTTYLDDIG
ncbi:hypothetical protein EYB26_009782 [Talaromyces marneffei]|uniref:uncharacterized protein n=1 Tax=Talaromyces marneffei TaxID=37727 RepID=UPI0012A85374|nr:uncharacterized protein EYB26_009782 [Talaromyces marneffei]QGA22068.1 hypothetical protein EYB26_009782 [Talaromyces marneffei]